jgi:hypothetical protein
LTLESDVNTKLELYLIIYFGECATIYKSCDLF